MISEGDLEKLNHIEEFPLQALVKLSKLRRRVKRWGYDFKDIKSGEAILLLEAARVIECEKAKLLARQFLKLLAIHDTELRPVKMRTITIKNGDEKKARMQLA